MSDEQPVKESEAQLEIERLRKENAELAARVAEREGHSRGRSAAVIAWVVLGSLLLALAIPAIWVNRTLMDTDRWVETMAPLASDPAIQTTVANAVSDAVLEAVDVSALTEQYLPEQLQPLAAPIAGAVENFVRTQTLNFTRSDKFATAWAEANRITHATLVKVITERDGAVLSNQGGVISIHTGPIAEEIKQRLVDRGLTILNRVPTTRLDKEIVLVDQPWIAEAARMVNQLQALAYWLPLLAAVAYGLALLTATDRRKAILWAGWGALIATILPLQGLYLGRVPVVSYFSSLGSGYGPAAEAAYGIVFRDLASMERWVALIAALIVLGALVAGPARAAVAIRGAFTGGASSLSSRFDFGPFGEFVAGNKRVLRGAGLAVAALIVLYPTERANPMAWIVWTGIVLLVWLAAVEFFGGSGGVPESAPEPAPESVPAAEDATEKESE